MYKIEQSLNLSIVNNLIIKLLTKGDNDEHTQ